MIQQVTIFMENKKGSLIGITEILKDADINIISTSLSDTEDFGLLRLIVSRPQLAFEKLREQQFSVHLSKVLAVSISTEVGALHELLLILEDFDIEYFYVYSDRRDFSGVILRVLNQNRAKDLLQTRGYRIFTNEEVYNNYLKE